MAVNIRQSIVKTYRVVGIVLLVAVLFALISYLTVNVYYTMSRSWVMPELLTTNDTRVVAAVTALGDAENRLDEMAGDRDEAALAIKRLEREIGEAETFLATYGSALPGVSNLADRAMLQRALSDARIAADTGKERIETMEAGQAALNARIARQTAIVKQMELSPYLRVAKGNVAVVFVPYKNLSNVEAGASLYSCWATLLFCSRVGAVKAVLPGEAIGRSPQELDIQRGVLAEVEVSETGMRERVLFVGGAPLLF